jgi:hypothetical protein
MVVAVVASKDHGGRRLRFVVRFIVYIRDCLVLFLEDVERRSIVELE